MISSFKIGTIYRHLTGARFMCISIEEQYIVAQDGVYVVRMRKWEFTTEANLLDRIIYKYKTKQLENRYALQNAKK